MTLPTFDHLLAMSDAIGTFEHADHREPRREEGYCTDDMARLLVIIAREPNPSRDIWALGRTTLRFVADAQTVTGAVRNRRDDAGQWHGKYGTEDCWGRSVWAFGTVVARTSNDLMRQSARSYFEHAIQMRSPWPRSMAFAALGAAEVLAVDPRHGRARQLLTDASVVVGTPGTDEAWPWPEPRLTYANAVIPEAMIAAGDLLQRPDLLTNGLSLLGWLLDRESPAGHLSPTPVGGAGPDDAAPAFDQQPIEVAAMADACARALTVTGDDRWREGVQMAVQWFLGANDAGVAMWDPQSGGGFDGLHQSGANLNEGAESTIAFVSTMQHARRLALAG